MTELTVKTVESTLLDCLLREGEEQNNSILVDGIVNSFKFHPQRLEQNKETIKQLLAQLPLMFRRIDHGGEGGASFLDAWHKTTGRDYPWGEHRDMERLFCLGMAVGEVVAVPFNRAHWPMMPGGFPYFVINTQP